jgi:predicted esterase YcpF (UPF0227 family)
MRAGGLILYVHGLASCGWGEKSRALAHFDVVVEDGGNHRVENFPDYLPRIAAFLSEGP